MDKKFKSIYLVCIEHQNDMNYVVARNPSLKKARSAAQQAKTQFPDEEVYITVEKILKENPGASLNLGLGPAYAANLGSSKCVCGYKKGGCVSNLSCRCSAISLCKQMSDDDDSPYFMLSGQGQTEDFEEVEINVIRVSRNLVEVLIPDWADDSIGLSANEFPRDVLRELKDGTVITAMINIDAETANDLILRDIKIAYEDEAAHELEEDFEGYELEDGEEEDYELEDGDEDEDYELEDDYGVNPDELTQDIATPLSWNQSHTERALDVEDELEDDDISEDNLLK